MTTATSRKKQPDFRRHPRSFENPASRPGFCVSDNGRGRIFGGRALLPLAWLPQGQRSMPHRPQRERREPACHVSFPRRPQILAGRSVTARSPVFSKAFGSFFRPGLSWQGKAGTIAGLTRCALIDGVNRRTILCSPKVLTKHFIFAVTPVLTADIRPPPF